MPREGGCDETPGTYTAEDNHLAGHPRRLTWHGACVQIDVHGWRAAGGGTNALSAGVSNAAGWGLETILTMALVFTVFAATDAERASDTAHLPVRPVR